MTVETDLRRAAREIFTVALGSVDASDAVRRAVSLKDSLLTIRSTTFDLSKYSTGIYVLAIGKAAFSMAAAIDEILGEKIVAGLAIGSSITLALNASPPFNYNFSSAWRICEGSHPLPDEASLKAAQHSFELLQRANAERALVIFLISGGGSAMVEWPRRKETTISEIRAANRTLVSCGASIVEINAVRRSFSAVKGGRLSAHAPATDQVTLIISDTGRGHEAIVASGPTCDPPEDMPDAASVIAHYNLTPHLPASILRAVNQYQAEHSEVSPRNLRQHHVLLTNDDALKAAADEAQRRGFMVEIAEDISEQPVAEGCALLYSRLDALRRRASAENRIACLISGGEFSCPVNGDGIGGRNAETVLRLAIEMNEHIRQDAGKMNFRRLAMLSAGTDGIDGNSPASGAVACETTITRAHQKNLDVREFLEQSDAHSFFAALGDAIVTGSTGTNVRDVRIMLAD